MSYEELNQVQRYAVDIYHVIGQLFNEEEENPEFRYSLNQVDATDFLTGYLLAFNMLFNALTDGDNDLLDTISIANRLTFQYLLKHGESED